MNTKAAPKGKTKAMTYYVTPEEERMFREIAINRPDLPMTKTGILRVAFRDLYNKVKTA